MPHRFKELHYIIHIENIGSVMEYGILSHDEIIKKGIQHNDISNLEVQEKRSRKIVPNGLPLHQYAPTYFDARNAMMYEKVQQGNINHICVLRISKEVINIPGVVAYDMNAAKNMAKPIPIHEIENLPFDLIYAEYWIDSNQIEQDRKKAIKQAELLVPNIIPYNYVIGAYVYNELGQNLLSARGFDKMITINSDLFFNGGNNVNG